MLQGHDAGPAAHAPVQHTNGAVEGHCCSHVDASAMHTLLFAAQRYGITGGHGQFASDDRHDESQHWTSVDAHFVHRSVDTAHRPVFAQVT